MDFEELHGIVTENNIRITTILKKVKVIRKIRRVIRKI